jgi:myosin heavy subunit
MMDVIRILQQGFAVRMTHLSFFQTYSVLVPGCANVKDLVRIVSKRLHVDNCEWQVGNTKVFMRTTLSNKLKLLASIRARLKVRIIQNAYRDHIRKRSMRESCVMLQRQWRRHSAQKVYDSKKMGALKIQAWVRGTKQRRFFTRLTAATVHIQRTWRGMLTRQRLRREQAPYKQMSIKQ